MCQVNGFDRSRPNTHLLDSLFLSPGYFEREFSASRFVLY